MSDAGLYHEAILRLARTATGAGRLDAPDGVAVVDNPLCGDRVRIEIGLAGNRVVALAHEVRGCVICEAAAAVIGAAAPGATAASLEVPGTALADRLDGGTAAFPPGWSDLDMFLPVREHRSRHRCALLPFEALARALEAARKGT